MIKKKRNQRILKISEALLMGLRIPYKEWNIALTDDYRLVTIIPLGDGQESSLALGEANIRSLQYIAEKLTEDQYNILLANIGLNKGK